MADRIEPSSGGTPQGQVTQEEFSARIVDLGRAMHALCEQLWPLPRSITGQGVRQTLALLQSQHLPGLQVCEIPSGEACFDWTVPNEWNIRDAYVLDPDGNRILDFRDSNLHVLGYSQPVDAELPLAELQDHLYSIPEQPDAIPYVTSYYQERWGFCLPHAQRTSLKPGRYRAVIDSELSAGSLTYGELILPGQTGQEVLLSTYICHPSMANDNLSGVAVTTYLARWLASLERRKYTYRILFLPETIGSLAYLSLHLETLRANVVAGYALTCLGDDRAYSYLPSRAEDTLADRVALHVLGHMHPDFDRYTYLERGSDERQYCSPGVDLPVASVMRSKYGTYPEYHTSLDDLRLVTPSGLAGGYEVLARCLECLERNETLGVTVTGEPQLGRRGLYPTLSRTNSAVQARDLMNLLAYSDGNRSLLDVAEKIGVPMWDLFPWVERLQAQGLLSKA